MKKINTLLSNENVKASLVIGAVFLVTALLTIYGIYKD